MRRFKRNESGQSLVEMALVLPILLMLLLGIIECGRIFGSYMELQSTARDAVRYAAVHNIAEEEDQAPAILTSLIEGRLVLLDPNNLRIEFEQEESNNQKDKWATVSLEYDLDIIYPFIGLITDNTILVLNSEMVMRVE
ncbi:hypothetical protein SYNTR_1695 [Candidatus Syntrophocurvum alkaliphilum]|uniref:TadE-like domain-containing protein n=1 Tax=Candidatus Syntrophocurvum alkaliphilum TaxID=2293317 RepID=A0A6I6DGR8_9FIRM|nr:hypothetical protein SYNTR_1695 [Candidatus Syntrophocurvum alkaliphilum]